MKLIAVTGFLGSGKTTFMIKLAQAAMDDGLKPAILVNEIGDIGIDDQFMKHINMNVWEILGGCICCTLAASLPETLLDIEKNYKPDLVLLEPSGAAEPGKMLDVLDGYQGLTKLIRKNILLLDAMRFPMLAAVLTPLITAQVEYADIIAVNKVDAAEPEDIEDALDFIRTNRPEIKPVECSARQGLNPDLIREIMS